MIGFVHALFQIFQSNGRNHHKTKKGNKFLEVVNAMNVFDHLLKIKRKEKICYYMSACSSFFECFVFVGSYRNLCKFIPN